MARKTTLLQITLRSFSVKEATGFLLKSRVRSHAEETSISLPEQEPPL